MRIEKVLGNNIVSSRDEQENEIVVMGKGIGFKASAGDIIDESLINKVFILDDDDQYYFKELVKKMPGDYIAVANEIINYAKITLGKELSDFIYITLTDHLNYAIERAKENLNFENQFLWEIKRYYDTEFQIGLTATELIKEKLGIDLPEDEAGFIAIHIVNAELGSDLTKSSQLPRIIQDLINIITYHFKVPLDIYSLDYERFLTHLKFFLQRVIKNESYVTEDAEFCEMVIKRYPEAYECVCVMDEYLVKHMDYQMSLEEKMYLTVHVRRLIHNITKS